MRLRTTNSYEAEFPPHEIIRALQLVGYNIPDDAKIHIATSKRGHSELPLIVEWTTGSVGLMVPRRFILPKSD